MKNGNQGTLKPLYFVAGSRGDLRAFPEDVRQCMGTALYWAQLGDKHPDAKPLKGFKGARVLEVVEDHDGDTFRAVYTVRFTSGIYVLHAFQKKSKRGIKTPKKEIDLIETRLKLAATHHREIANE